MIINGKVVKLLVKIIESIELLLIYVIRNCIVESM